MARDRIALLLLASLAILVVGPSLMPDRAFLSIHSAVRDPLATSLEANDRRELRERGNLDTGDQLFQVLPERRAFLEALRAGELPLWWREAGGGLSLLGAPGGEFTEPRTLLLSWLLGPIDALGVLAALSIFTLAALTYWFLRLRELSPLAAAAGGIAFACSGAIACNLYYVCKVDAMVLLPAGLAAVELWLRGRRPLAFALLGLAAADSALASFPQNTALCAYLLVLLGSLRLREASTGRGEAWRGALGLGVPLALGLAVAAFHLLPVGDWGRQSDRPFTLAGGGYAVGPAHALSLLAPFALGDPTSTLAARANPCLELVPGLLPYNFTESTFYAGLAAIPLALAGLARGRRALLPALGWALAMAVAAGTPFSWLPGVGVSAPSRALASASFFVAWLAAEGLDALPERSRARRAAVAGTLLLLLAAGGALLVRNASGETVARRIGAARAAASVPAPSGELRQLWIDRWDREVRPGLLAVALWGAASALAVGAACRWPRLRGVAALVLAADLAGFVLHVTPPTPRRNLLGENPTLRDVRRSAAGGRIARVAPGEEIGGADFELFQATLPPWFSIADVAAYVVMPNAEQAAVLRALFPPARNPNVLLLDTYFTALPRSALRGPAPDLLGVSVVICRSPIEEPGLESVADRAGFFAYRRRDAAGPAWIVPRAVLAPDRAAALAAIAAPGFDPKKTVVLESAPPGTPSAAAGGGTVSVRRVSNREVALRVLGTGGGFLVEPEPGCRGWSATLDGAPTPLLRANGAFRAVQVPPGDHEVRFTYLPGSFVAGSAISLVSLAFLAAGILFLRRRAP